MTKRNKHIKNIKIYHSEHCSFRDLKSSNFFSYFYSQDDYQKPLMEALINIVRDINPKDSFGYDEFIEELEYYFSMSEINHKIILPKVIITTLIEEVYYIYAQGKFHKFRGEILEFFMVYLEKSNDSKIYHEPSFYHKRTRLFKRQFPGSNCLIDVVKVNNETKYISLIECKANINNNIRNMKREFKNKLRHMDALENELSDYINYSEQSIKISKTLATISDPIVTLPGIYKNYSVINLYSHFRLMRNK